MRKKAFTYLKMIAKVRKQIMTNNKNRILPELVRSVAGKIGKTEP